MTNDEVQYAQRASDAGLRVAAFLKDEAIKGAFIALEKRYVAEFKDSKTPADREAVHAKFTALNDIFASTLGVVDSGTIAAAKLARNTQAQDVRQRTPRSR